MAFNRRETAILLIGDFLILVASLWVALLLRNLALPSWGYFESNVIPFSPMFLVSLVVFYISGLYEKQTRHIQRVMGARIFGAQTATVAIAAILFFVLPLSIAPKTILLLYLLVSTVTETSWRLYRTNRSLKEEDRIPALLVGSGSAMTELYEEINHNNRYPIRFAGHIDTAQLTEGSLSEAIAAGVASGAHSIVVNTSDPLVLREGASLFDFASREIVFTEFASLYEEIFDRVPLDHLNTKELVESVSQFQLFYVIAKRLFDIGLALVLSVIAIPFVLIAAALLAIENGSPFLTHERIGKNGRSFRIWKLRSMLFDDHGNADLQKKNRVTALGKMLRKTRIDELPQLWNVLVGNLSFIGPRPELPVLAAVYEKEIPQYKLRHLIAPGLSGWAQIHDYDAPRGGADVVRTRRKLSLDLYYLKHRSLGLDLAIALKTLRALISFSGV